MREEQEQEQEYEYEYNSKGEIVITLFDPIKPK